MALDLSLQSIHHPDFLLPTSSTFLWHFTGIWTLPNISLFLQKTHSNISKHFLIFKTWNVSIVLTTPISWSNCYRSKRRRNRSVLHLTLSAFWPLWHSQSWSQDCPHARRISWNNAAPRHTGFQCRPRGSIPRKGRCVSHLEITRIPRSMFSVGCPWIMHWFWAQASKHKKGWQGSNSGLK